MTLVIVEGPQQASLAASLKGCLSWRCCCPGGAAAQSTYSVRRPETATVHVQRRVRPGSPKPPWGVGSAQRVAGTPVFPLHSEPPTTSTVRSCSPGGLRQARAGTPGLTGPGPRCCFERILASAAFAGLLEKASCIVLGRPPGSGLPPLFTASVLPWLWWLRANAPEHVQAAWARQAGGKPPGQLSTPPPETAPGRSRPGLQFSAGCHSCFKPLQRFCPGGPRTPLQSSSVR